MTRASTWYYSVKVPPPHEGTADPSLVCPFTCILGTLRRRPRHFSPHYLTSLSATLYGRWLEANICFVPDLTFYRTPTCNITVSILAQLPFLFLSFLYNPVPDLTCYRTPTSNITVFILAQLPFRFPSFLHNPVPDLTFYRTPTSNITVFILAQLPFPFLPL